jgi:hypothetical protein
MDPLQQDEVTQMMKQALSPVIHVIKAPAGSSISSSHSRIYGMKREGMLLRWLSLQV